MDEPRWREQVAPSLALGVCVMLGLILGGWLLGSEVKAMKMADRFVTVKGLVERTVKSDRATWAVSFKTAGNDLATVFAKSEADKQKVLLFFSGQGFPKGEMSYGQIKVTDKQTNEFAANVDQGSRYIVTQTVTVSTADVDKMARAGERTADLVQAGVVLASAENGQASGIVYKFGGLNGLKPDMITEATRNARASADRFAADSGSQVGAIRSASQGVFSIAANDVAGAGDEGGGAEAGADASIMKRVRVVSTIDYYLVK